MRTQMIIVVAISLSQCTSSAEREATASVDSTAEVFAFADPPAMALVPPPPLENVPSQKLMRSADLHLTVEHLTTTSDSIQRLNKKYNAQTRLDAQQIDGRDRSQHLEIIVEEKNFDALVNTITALAKRVDTKQISVEDLTEEYVDTDARMRTKKEIERRYLQILAKANSVKDILAIEEQVGAVREEIESMEARLKYIDRRSTYSTISVTLSETTTAEATNRFAAAIGSGWKSMIDGGLDIIARWPIVILIMAVTLSTIRFFRRRKKKMATTA